MDAATRNGPLNIEEYRLTMYLFSPQSRPSVIHCTRGMGADNMNA